MFIFFSQEAGSEHNQTFLSLTTVTVTCVQCVDVYGKGNNYKSDLRELKITWVVYQCSLTFSPYNEKMWPQVWKRYPLQPQQLCSLGQHFQDLTYSFFFLLYTDQEIKDIKTVHLYVISCFNLFSLSFHRYSFVPENNRRHNVKWGV